MISLFLSLVDVWLGEELFAEAGVAPEPQDERDAHDEEGPDDDEGDQEGSVSLLDGWGCILLFLRSHYGSRFWQVFLYQGWEVTLNM